jgi:hypothetical protein
MLSEWRQFSHITNFLHGFESNLSTLSLDSIHILSFIVLFNNSNFCMNRTKLDMETLTENGQISGF